MRILLSFLQDLTQNPHAIPAYRFWEYYIKNGIEEAGMSWLEVADVDWAEGLLYNDDSQALAEWKTRTWQKTLDYINKNKGKIDIFLSYLHPKQIDISAINELKKIGIPCVNFYCDNIREFNKIPNEFRAFDLNWVPEYEAIPMYKSAGISQINCPMPMWVDPKYRTPVNEIQIPKIAFIGSKDPYREELIAKTVAKGLKIYVQGKGWSPEDEDNAIEPFGLNRKLMNQVDFIRKNGLKSFIIKGLQKLETKPDLHLDSKYILPKPSFNEYIEITQSSTVIIGINRVPTFKKLHCSPSKYSRLRDIEAPMLGACYLTEYCNGLDKMYDLTHDISTYHNKDELFFKASELLANKDLRNKLRLNGQKKALAELSIPVTLNKIKSKIF